MPPRATHNPVDDPEFTLRLKHGIHTVFLFVMPDWTFAQLSAELLEILRDRFPDGLQTSTGASGPPKTTAVPDDNDTKIVYGVPRKADDLSKGWRNLKASDDDTLASKKLTDLTAVAFALVDPMDDDEEVEFEVELPSFEEEE
ncbi:hypothetical protein OQA88_7703 [Cercophora sp. LCS_1]